MPSRIAQGQAGVYTVAAQLLLRGINPCFPAVDCGADIITDWGTRIQVKSAYRRASIWGGSYHFMLDCGVTQYTGGNTHRKSSLRDRAPRIFSNECDFFAMWGIDDNRFWIIPASILDGRTSANMVGPDTPWLRLDDAAILADSKRGMSQREIARKYNICQKTVLRSLNGKSLWSRTDIAYNKVLLSHEDRWGLIHAEENLLSEGEANLVVPATAEEV